MIFFVTEGACFQATDSFVCLSRSCPARCWLGAAVHGGAGRRGDDSDVERDVKACGERRQGVCKAFRVV